MKPGPSRIIACPKCGTKVSVSTMMSGNGFGARIWSDGYVDAPMLCDEPRATKCRNCQTIFWLSDGKYVGSWWQHDNADNERWENEDLAVAWDLLPVSGEPSIRSRCEILRELGRFREAETLASDELRSYAPLLKAIVKKCRENDPHLLQYPKDRPFLVAEMHVAGTEQYDLEGIGGE